MRLGLGERATAARHGSMTIHSLLPLWALGPAERPHLAVQASRCPLASVGWAGSAEQASIGIFSRSPSAAAHAVPTQCMHPGSSGVRMLTDWQAD
jgi:hypothetical protein